MKLEHTSELKVCGVAQLYVLAAEEKVLDLLQKETLAIQKSPNPPKAPNPLSLMKMSAKVPDRKLRATC